MSERIPLIDVNPARPVSPGIDAYIRGVNAAAASEEFSLEGIKYLVGDE